MSRLGLVETRYIELFNECPPLVLESGERLAPVRVAYETYGTLDADRSNAVFICHALSGDAHAAGHHGDPSRRGWWDELVAPGGTVDTSRFFVVCANLLGGCSGTTGPSSIDPKTREPYGLRFPMLTVRDLVAVHRALLQALGVTRLRAAIGGSLGGMQVLQWALDHPGEIDLGLLVCTTAKLNAQNIALSAIARRAIMQDPDFQDGGYLCSDRHPHRGLAVARQIGHVNYLSVEAMEQKFGRERRHGAMGPMTMHLDFEVEHYLDHQADRFTARFDALSYLYLARAMDYFDPLSSEEVDLGRVDTRFLAISFDSDWRFGTEHSQHLVTALRAGGVDASHVEVSSPWGHDSFLTNGAAYAPLLRQAIESWVSVRRGESEAVVKR
jgi:homoserine O-acetyltransferase/O-succinyltransferase